MGDRQGTKVPTSIRMVRVANGVRLQQRRDTSNEHDSRSDSASRALRGSHANDNTEALRDETTSAGVTNA